MADIKVKIAIEGDVHYAVVRIDQAKVSFDSSGSGKIAVLGDMGDRSKHLLEASIFGALGGKLSVALTCGGIELASPEPLEITADTEPYYATQMKFTLEQEAE